MKLVLRCAKFWRKKKLSYVKRLMIPYKIPPKTSTNPRHIKHSLPSQLIQNKLMPATFFDQAMSIPTKKQTIDSHHQNEKSTLKDDIVTRVKHNTSSIEPSITKRSKITKDRFKQLLNFHEPLFDKRVMPKNFGVLDVNKLEYSIRNLQKCLNTVLENSPDVVELNRILSPSSELGTDAKGDGQVVDNGIKSQLKNNEFIIMSSRLKSLYRLGKLPILSEIINDEVKLTEEDIDKLLELSANGKQQDEGYIVDANGDHITQGITLQLPKSNLSDINLKGVNDDLPELPKINDDKLYERVFTHRSCVNNKNYLSNKEILALHNERLEFLGDSILNNLVTLIIFEEFPDCNEGELSRIRASFVCNKTLLQFAYKYGFDKRLRAQINKEAINSGDKKIYADVFEAYVGALGIERGSNLKEVHNWLHKLYTPLILETKQEHLKEPLDNNAKSELYSLIGRADMHPEYIVIREGDGVDKNFTVSCRMNGEELGVGVEKSIKDAGLRAAMEALNNKEVLSKYFLERQLIEKPVKQERMKRELIRKELRLRELEQEKENEKANFALTPPSPIQVSMFPIDVIGPDSPLENDSKGELYGLLGKRIGVKPEYVSYTNPEGDFISELRVRGILICSVCDRSKKKAMTRAAQTLLHNKLALDEICKDFRTKDSTSSSDSVSM